MSAARHRSPCLVIDYSNTPWHGIRMFNILSVLIGLVALVIGLVGLLPLFGWLNWIALPLAVIGTAIGILSSHDSGRNLNILVLLFGSVRLFLGGGLL